MYQGIWAFVVSQEQANKAKRGKNRDMEWVRLVSS